MLMHLPPIFRSSSRSGGHSSSGIVIDGRGVPAGATLRPEGLAQPRRDLTGAIVAENALAEPSDRHDTACRGGKEDFVPRFQLAPRDRADRVRDAELLEKLHDREPRNALKRAAPRAHHPAVDHGECIEARPSVRKPSRSSRTAVSNP